jgi:hypothetical protein
MTEAAFSQDRQRVRDLQRQYVDVWATQLRALDSDLTLDRARAMAHVAFGLINSTPHSGRLPDDQMRAMLTTMAAGALGLAPAVR